MQYTTSIDLSDNHLSDDSLVPILAAVKNIACLLSLNLSRNRFGISTSKAMAEYLDSTNCHLKALVLQSCDIDDRECARFVRALSSNSSSTIEEIDLSNNKMGSSEARNFIDDRIMTGGEAIAEFLRSKVCRLQSLKLSYNSIRLGSAARLTDSVAGNSSLTLLDLSYNALGTDGGLGLGAALESNCTLRELVLGHCGLGSRPCFVIGTTVLDHPSLTKLSIDWNPVGLHGARALMDIPLCLGDRVAISLVGCNVASPDHTFLFDPGSPCRSYDLDLENLFDRAIVRSLFVLVKSHPSYSISQFSVNGENIQLCVAEVVRQDFSPAQAAAKVALEAALSALDNSCELVG